MKSTNTKWGSDTIQSGWVYTNLFRSSQVSWIVQQQLVKYIGKALKQEYEPVSEWNGMQNDKVPENSKDISQQVMKRK